MLHLKRHQKEAVGLLQIGTFLEYFDLMLYVHMAVILNELFFPKTDPHTAALITAFSFCSTYVLRPIGAIIFGWIGDHVGRKSTVILTTLMMALSCLIMANLPTYAEIGITAAWVVTFCRVLQGLSTLGEKKGAEIYLTEITKPPHRYPVVALLAVSSCVGTMAALGIATLFTTSGFNWRIAFAVGSVVALVGAAARTRLRETPDFTDMQKRIKKYPGNKRGGRSESPVTLRKDDPIWKEKTDKRTLLAFFFITCAGPVCFYFSFIFCGNILKNTFGYAPEQIIQHNFILSIFDIFALLCVCLLSYKIHPLKILKIKAAIYVPFFMCLPYFLSHLSSPTELFLLQSVNLFFALTECPAAAVFIIHFPVLKRFTHYTFVAAISSAILTTITSFGFIYVTKGLGYWGLLFIMIPINASFLWGLRHFSILEKLNNRKPEAPEILDNKLPTGCV